MGDNFLAIGRGDLNDFPLPYHSQYALQMDQRFSYLKILKTYEEKIWEKLFIEPECEGLSKQEQSPRDHERET